MMFPLGVPAVLGLIFCVVAFGRIKRRGGAGFGMAVAGTCCSAVGLILFVGFVIALVNGFGEPERVGWDQVQAGDCLIDDDPFGASVVGCAIPHDAEAYAVFDNLGLESSEYPGEAALMAEARKQCEPRYEPYVGVPLSDSRLVSRTVVPHQLFWVVGERWAVCLVSRANGSQLGGPM